MIASIPTQKNPRVCNFDASMLLPYVTDCENDISQRQQQTHHTGYHATSTASALNAEDEERERLSSASGAGGGWCNDGHIIIHCRLRGRRSDHNCAGSIGGGRLGGAT